MRSVFVLLALLALRVVAAQYVLDISSLRLTTNGIPLHVDTLFTDGSPDADAGTTQVGMMGAGPLRFQKRLPDALFDLFRASEASAHNGPRVALRINTLRLEEHRSGTEGVGTSSVHFTFYMKEGTEWYIVDEQGSTLSDFDLTSTEGLLPLLTASINECVDGFLRNHATGATVHIPARLDMKRSAEPALEPAILRATAFRKGLFHDFEHFKANMPDTVTPFTINRLRTANGNPKRARLELSKGDPRVLWGFSDGKRLYVNAGRFFVELVREGGEFTTMLPNEAADNPASSASMVMVGGMYGILFGNAMVAAFSPGASSGPNYYNYRLDMLTGRLNMSGIAGQKVVTSRHYFILDDGSAEGSSVALFEGDSLLVQLTPGTFFEFSPERQLDPVALLLKASSGQSSTVLLDTYRLDPQAFTVRVRKDGALSVKEPPKSVLVDVIDGLKEDDRAPLPE